MKNSCIDKLYADLDKHMLLAQAYTEMPELYFIIKGCRLKPNEYIFDFNKRLVLQRFWFDEFGNSLEIKKKKPKIKYNDLSLERERIICTDLYYGLPLHKIAKISKLVYICAGIDEDKFEEAYFLTFLGIDDYLRSYMYLWGEWETVSPLLLGMKQLSFIARNIDITGFREMSNYKNFPMPCVSGQSYLSYLPASKDFLEIIGKKHEILGDIFI